MNKLKKNFFNILIGLIFLAGIGLLLYPTFSNWWNSNMASHAVSDYSNIVSELSHEDQQQILDQARDYNDRLPFNPGRLTSSLEEQADYNSQLAVNGTDLMGSIEIPAADIDLPIYHGTSDAVLSIGVGHLEGSSLPVGGLGTHTVLTGHRGLPSALLFTDLDQVREGDYIILHIMGETLTYRVNQIRIVDPSEVGSIKKESDKDQITLVTCTPYGINSHRLLVTGQRVENLKELSVLDDASQIDPMTVAVCLGVVLILLYLLIRKIGRRMIYG